MELKECVEIWNRMCESMKDCEDCPVCNYGCNPLEASEFLDQVEDELTAWAATHPKKIYPTILELLRYIAKFIPNGTNMPLNELVKLRLPEDVAEEFGIVPINECGLNKYDDDEEVESEWR